VMTMMIWCRLEENWCAHRCEVGRAEARPYSISNFFDHALAVGEFLSNMYQTTCSSTWLVTLYANYCWLNTATGHSVWSIQNSVSPHPSTYYALMGTYN
jgi:hypothetical protein